MAYELKFDLDDDIGTTLNKNKFYFKEWDQEKILSKVNEIEKSLIPKKPAFNIIVAGKNLTNGDDDRYLKEFKQTLTSFKRLVKLAKKHNDFYIAKGGNRCIEISYYDDSPKIYE